MKCLMINTFDIEGGAARAAYRLHKGLQRCGIASKMLVQDKFGEDTSVIGPQSKFVKGLNKLRPHLDTLPLKLYPKRQDTPWGLAWLPGKIETQIEAYKPDIVHLHWVCGGFIPISTLPRLGRPLVWTLHDSWAFTGGCHIPYECTRYKESCGVCPQLDSKKNIDLSRWVWGKKLKHWNELDLTVVTPSRWLAGCAQASSLFRNTRVKVIPNGLDLTVYKPFDRQFARYALGLPKDTKLILFGAMDSTTDSNKGFQYLQPALKQLAADGWGNRVQTVVFGASKPENPPDFGLKSHYLGRLRDDISLSLLYAAADVFVAPSIQENLSNTVMEALACGIPCVAFKIGGMPDLIEHEFNGYLAKPYDPADLARGIDWVLSGRELWLSLSHNARAKVEREFELGLIAERYVELYSEILENR